MFLAIPILERLSFCTVAGIGHKISQGMVGALDEIIPRLKRDGMRFVTVPDY